MMPEMNGEELLETIRENSIYNDVKCVMVTAAYKIKNPDRVRDMGFDAYLLKPVYASELFDTVVKVIEKGQAGFSDSDTGGEEEPETQEQAREQTGAKTLLVEDSIVNRMFAEEVLLDLGHDVDTAENGRIALEMMETKSYDLILMDCMMPEMDGYEATQAIRDKEKSNDGGHIPIIAMTANAMEGDREKCLDAGMDDYIAKPARQEDIKVILGKYIVQAA